MQWVLIAHSPAAFGRSTHSSRDTARRGLGVPPAPPHSHPRRGRRIPGSRPRLCRKVARTARWSQEAAGSEPAASPAGQPRGSLLKLLQELSPTHVPATAPAPAAQANVSRFPHEARGAGNKPVSTPDSAQAAGEGGEPVNSLGMKKKKKSAAGRFGHGAVETSRVTARSASGSPRRAREQPEPSSEKPGESVPSHPRPESSGVSRSLSLFFS